MLREFLCPKGLQPAVSQEGLWNVSGFTSGEKAELFCFLMTSSSWLHRLLRLQPVISVWEHLSRTVFLGMEEGAVGIEYSWVDCLCLAPLHTWSFCLAISLSRRLVCSDSEVEKGDRRGLHWIWPQNCHCILFQLWLSFFILKSDRVYSLDLCEMGAKECWHFFFLCACLIHPCP